MPELQNRSLAVGSVQAASDLFGDLATDVATDAQVDNAITGNKSYGDAIAPDADNVNVVNPNCGPVFHCVFPTFPSEVIAHSDLALVLTHVGNAA